MLANLSVQRGVKASLLLGLSLFLYTRLTGGTLYFYISERFGWLTLTAILGLVVVGISYGAERARQNEEACADGCSHEHDHNHNHNHSHAIGWGGALIVALPILLGLLTPPRPLGANALAVRELSVSGLASALPAAVQGATAKADVERSVLDWVLAFQAGGKGGESFAGRSADVVGFVHRREGDGESRFWLTRYVVGCCVADAAPVGLWVEWSAAADLQADSWVRVQGALAEEVGAAAPVLSAQSVELVPPPNQPYLYP